MVWDLDGTLVDTRPRLAALAASLGRAVTFHDEEYWDPALLVLDEPIAETMAAARLRQQQSIVLTGRIEETQRDTEEQLAHLGFVPLRVITKPALDVTTPQWKAETLASLSKEVRIGAYVTDAQDEIDAIRALLPRLPCILWQERPFAAAPLYSPWVERNGASDLVMRIACEHLLNDREGRARQLDGTIERQYARGDLFSLPLVSVSKDRAVIIGAGDELGLVRSDDVLLPLHPQELAHHPDYQIATTIPVRATSSGRTLITERGVMMKTSLAHVFMDRVKRDLTVADAQRAITTSTFMEATNLDFCRERFAVADRQTDTACVVRTSSWSTIPAYCLWADAREFGSNLPLASVLGATIVMERVIEPAVKAMLVLVLDAGCAYLGHGQNVHVEVDENFHPTGRVVFADMEDVWPHPQLARGFEFSDEYLRAHAATRHSDVDGTFQDYFVWRLLHALLKCPRIEGLRASTVDLLRREVRARKDRIDPAGPLKWFATL